MFKRKYGQGDPTLVVALADFHCGSTVGLMRPEQWQLSEGGYYTPSWTQKQLFHQFDETVQIIKKKRKKSRLVTFFVGDMVDGNHHRTTQIVSPREEEQEQLAEDVIDYYYQEVGYDPDAGDLSYFVEGTPAHVGEGAQSENRIARDLGAVPRREGTPEKKFKDARYTWAKVLVQFNGVLFHVTHHSPVTPGTRAHTRGNSLRALLISLYFERLDQGKKVPRYWLWAHRHIFTHALKEGRQAKTEAFILPAYQARTEFVNRRHAHELATIGTWYAEIEPDGQTDWRCPRIEFDDDETILKP